MNQTQGWLEARLPVRNWYQRHWRDHPMPADLPFTWSFGPLIGVALAVLTLSGIWLGLAYRPGPHAALSIVTYTRAVPFGWLIRDLHRAGTTMLFGVVYWELLRGMYAARYRSGRELVWIIEIVRFALFLAIGFFGFAMTGSPAAQASVLIMADHLAALPLFGAALAQDFVGGGAINPTTSPHMAMSHEAFGFLVLLVAGLGAFAARFAPAAHQAGGTAEAQATVPQSTYTARYFTAFLIFALIFALIVTVAPGLGYPVGTVLPAPMALPLQVVPPWFLLPFHGFARAGQSAGGGLFLTILALVLLAALPWLDRRAEGRGKGAGGRVRPAYAGFLVLLAVDVGLLSIAAAQPAAGIWPAVIDLTTIWFFAHFLIVTPLVGMFEPAQPGARRAA